jgi:hypothetical protein
MREHTGIALTLVVLLFVSVLPAQAWRGYGRHRGLSVAIVPQLIVPVMPYWRPYVYPSVYPPVVVAPTPPAYVQPVPQVYIQPFPPQTYWYYCDDPPGYYPYVQQCPEGWRQVNPLLPQ